MQQLGLWSRPGGRKENIEEKYPNKDLKEVAGNEMEMGRGIGREFPQKEKLSQLWAPLLKLAAVSFPSAGFPSGDKEEIRK